MLPCPGIAAPSFTSVNPDRLKDLVCVATCQVVHLMGYSVGVGLVFCSCEPQVLWDVTLHIDFTVIGHGAIYPEKCFSMLHP